MSVAHDPQFFTPYPKTGRLNSAKMAVTEKIDGTNGLIVVQDGKVVCVGSRKRAITPESDNFGFARWVYENAEILVPFLGEGEHYGEWAGPGIQRNPLRLPEKFFYLFNVHRHPEDKFANVQHPEALRAVPILARDADFCLQFANDLLASVAEETGSRVPEANPGGPPPLAEGIIISAFGSKFKMTPDQRPKGARHGS